MYTSRETRFWNVVATWAKIEGEIAEAEAATEAGIDAAKATAYRKATEAKARQEGGRYDH